MFAEQKKYTICRKPEIKAQPVGGAVLVVRCKDCRYGLPGKVFGTNAVACALARREMHLSDFYCKYGTKIHSEESGTEKIKTDVFDAYIKKYGDLQLVVACEEMAELQKELCKALRGKPDVDHTAEEISDVEIMLEQVKRMYDCAGAVETWKRKKIARMVERMECDGR